MRDIDDMPAGIEQVRPFAPLSFRERARFFLNQFVVRFAVGAVIAAVVGGYLFGSARTPQAESTSTFTTQNTVTTTGLNSTTINTSIKVYITGEVNAPGVVDVDTHARVVDVIAKAGGTTANADITHCNLAAFVADGSSIIIPGHNSQTSCGGAVASGTLLAGDTDTKTSSAQSSGKINLNTATQSEIETLPGVGPTLGAAILSYRSQHGSFSSIADLRKVKGIGDKRFSDLKDLVTV
ncbi:MAG TPA: helix-hairpin-helix domain-containing protein [Acidimicrobiia bacterium]|nr:helix-hairpin-helix domain-containing protein [Acidimicrobiia bacterium]